MLYDARQKSPITTVRAQNLSVVLNLIYEAGSISRAAIVRQTPLSAPTVSSIVSELLGWGIVSEAGTGQSRGGRRPILIGFNYDFYHVLGVEMGATHITVIVTDLKGRILAGHTDPFEVVGNPVEAVEKIRTMAIDMMAACDAVPSDFMGMGITIPAALDGENLQQVCTLFMPDWHGFDLIGTLAGYFEMPILIDNDANAGAIAEKWLGHGRFVKDLAFIKLDVGVGSGIILDHHVFRGAGGTAGEIGHTTIDVNGPVCRCGNRGCMESFVGTPAILKNGSDRKGELAPLTVKMIAEAAVAGDAVCREIVEQAGTHLGVGIANLLNLVNPNLVILGGDLTLAGEVLMAAVWSSVRSRAMPKAVGEVRIELSEMGDDVVAIGAAMMVIQSRFSPSNLIRTVRASA